MLFSRTVSSTRCNPNALAAASDRFAYWATSKSVWRVGLDGAGAVALLQTTNSVELIAVDASGLYAAIDTAGYAPPAYVVKIAEPN